MKQNVINLYEGLISGFVTHSQMVEVAINLIINLIITILFVIRRIKEWFIDLTINCVKPT